MSAHSRDAIVGGADAELIGVAMTYVSTRAVAEEVVQETWLGVLAGLDGFEGRSSLRTWIFRIAANVARTRAARERRSGPFSSMPGGNGDCAGSTVDPERFLPAENQRVLLHRARSTLCEALDRHLIATDAAA